MTASLSTGALGCKTGKPTANPGPEPEPVHVNEGPEPVEPEQTSDTSDTESADELPAPAPVEMVNTVPGDD